MNIYNYRYPSITNNKMTKIYFRKIIFWILLSLFSSKPVRTKFPRTKTEPGAQMR